MTTLPDDAALGRRFVDAISDKDREEFLALFDPKVDFRGLTPRDEWRATAPDGVLDVVLGNWFEPTDHVREVMNVEVRPFEDRYQLRYRLRVENDEGMFIVEQQGYFSLEDGRIARMGMVCSGFLPLGVPGAD